VLGQAVFLAHAWGELGEAVFYFVARTAIPCRSELKYKVSMKKGATGWDAAQARMTMRPSSRTFRLRVHEDCVLKGDEQLGLSALTGAKCGRCRLPIRGAAVMVQRFRCGSDVLVQDRA